MRSMRRHVPLQLTLILYKRTGNVRSPLPVSCLCICFYLCFIKDCVTLSYVWQRDPDSCHSLSLTSHSTYLPDTPAPVVPGVRLLHLKKRLCTYYSFLTEVSRPLCHKVPFRFPTKCMLFLEPNKPFVVPPIMTPSLALQPNDTSSVPRPLEQSTESLLELFSDLRPFGSSPSQLNGKLSCMTLR